MFTTIAVMVTTPVVIAPIIIAKTILCFITRVLAFKKNSTSPWSGLAVGHLAKPSTSKMASANSRGASWGKLCPIPPLITRCAYLPENFFT